MGEHSTAIPAAALSVGGCATLACIWEATAAKPGNVYRGADFDDLTYADFLTSAAVIGPIVEQAAEQGVGATVLAGVAATRAAVGTNTNLGMLLLIAPLAAAASTAGSRLQQGIEGVLAGLDHDDARHAYAAIPLAQPGGLGKAAEADVHEPPPAGLTLREAMTLAAERDLIARQYANGFAEVFQTAERIAAAAAREPLGEAIVEGFLGLLAEEPDSLIARKNGPETAREVSRRAAAVMEASLQDEETYRRLRAEFDFWLRADGHRRNPGTTADVVAAALFALLWEQRLVWPVRFY